MEAREHSQRRTGAGCVKLRLDHQALVYGGIVR
jgi:hypothetical protein